MTPRQAQLIAKELWGKAPGSKMAAALGVHRSQAWRYLRGVTAVPGPVSAALRGWQRAYRESGTPPPAEPE